MKTGMIARALLGVGLSALLAPLPQAAAAPLHGSPAIAAPAALAFARSGLGIVADGRRAGERGVLVVAVSPGSAGERMGVEVGDRLLAINGRSLDGVSAPNALISEALADGPQVRLELERDGAPMTLAGSASDALADSDVATDAGGACGWVSTVGVPPRVSRGIYRAEITQVNGRSTPLQTENRYQVPAGRQVLVVHEMIDRYRISRADERRIHRMQRRSRGGYRTLVVDVEPNTRYSIGAELLRDNLNPDGIRANSYWRPVVWESRAEACP